DPMLKPEILDTFLQLLDEAKSTGDREPTAMNLATVDAGGRISSRIVLLKGVDGRGFVFYTNYESRKGRDLEGNPRASLLFPWHAFERQVIADGKVSKVTREETEAYFHSRPRLSQLAAWASQQSAIISGRSVLEQSMRAVEQKYAGQEVPVPPQWGGYRLVPETIEFWQGRRSRLHDRLRYRREKDSWVIERLSP
ncbi:MAG TPA: pyridoxamine 5'-phosphate oxidase, partial [Opitutaceae bacterium]|nr:pyridoxamine 5'-phosphate oxidase [Opitutaceae bacterium]